MFGLYDTKKGRCTGYKWHGMYLLLLALFYPTTWEEDLPRDGVTRANLVDWVRMAYVECLGAMYPSRERERMNDVLMDEVKPKNERIYKEMSP